MYTFFCTKFEYYDRYKQNRKIRLNSSASPLHIFIVIFDVAELIFWVVIKPQSELIQFPNWTFEVFPNALTHKNLFNIFFKSIDNIVWQGQGPTLISNPHKLNQWNFQFLFKTLFKKHWYYYQNNDLRPITCLQSICLFI